MRLGSLSSQLTYLAKLSKLPMHLPLELCFDAVKTFSEIHKVWQGGVRLEELDLLFRFGEELRDDAEVVEVNLSQLHQSQRTEDSEGYRPTSVSSSTKASFSLMSFLSVSLLASSLSETVFFASTAERAAWPLSVRRRIS